MSSFKASELTLDSNGNVYHLGIGPADIADTILLVGDQGRVELIKNFFDTVRFEHQHREFYTVTGTFKGKEITALSTGIGTDNIDIVLNELDALVNIQLSTRTLLPVLQSLKLIRIGTCGSLQENIAPGESIVSRYAIGLDGVAGFYHIPFSPDELAASGAFVQQTQWPAHLNTPYFTGSDEALFNKLCPGFHSGITITANGFYGPQGRQLRVPLSIPDFRDTIRKFTWNQMPVANFEMESSALFALSKAMGHQAATVCLVVANRYTNQFEPDYKTKMLRLIEEVLIKLTV